MPYNDDPNTEVHVQSLAAAPDWIRGKMRHAGCAPGDGVDHPHGVVWGPVGKYQEIAALAKRNLDHGRPRKWEIEARAQTIIFVNGEVA